MSSDPYEIHREQLNSLIQPMLESDDANELLAQANDQIHSHEMRQSYDESLRDVLIDIVPDFLNHEDYQIAANAAIFVRKHSHRYDDPSRLNTIISDLTTQLHGRSIIAARCASSTLGFLLSSRPTDRKLPSWDGKVARGPSSDAIEDYDQSRFIEAPHESGYFETVDSSIREKAIDELIDNIDRKEYKESSDWKVGKECALAIGAIGYENPKYVEDAIPILLDVVDQDRVQQGTIQIGLSAVVYALSSIGYTRPDLVDDDFKTWIDNTLTHNTMQDMPPELWRTMKVFDRKIGHSPNYLKMTGRNAKSDLEPICDRLFMFMLEKYPTCNDTVIDSFIRIADSRPQKMMEILSNGLSNILHDDHRTLDFPSNLMHVLRELSKEHPTAMEPIAAQSLDIYNDSNELHYWFDCASPMLVNIHQANPDLIPDGLKNVLLDFLDDESRDSVQRSTKKLIDEIS